MQSAKQSSELDSLQLDTQHLMNGICVGRSPTLVVGELQEIVMNWIQQQHSLETRGTIQAYSRLFLHQTIYYGNYKSHKKTQPGEYISFVDKDGNINYGQIVAFLLWKHTNLHTILVQSKLLQVQDGSVTITNMETIFPTTFIRSKIILYPKPTNSTKWTLIDLCKDAITSIPASGYIGQLYNSGW